MEDLRFGILCSFINKKLGLVKKNPKMNNFINGMIHDLKKTIPKEKLENSNYISRILGEKSTIN